MVDSFLGIESRVKLNSRRRSDFSTSASSTAPSASSSPPLGRKAKGRDLTRRPSQLNLPDVPKSEVASAVSITSEKKGLKPGLLANSSSQNLNHDQPIYEDSFRRRCRHGFHKKMS